MDYLQSLHVLHEQWIAQEQARNTMEESDMPVRLVLINGIAVCNPYFQ